MKNVRTPWMVALAAGTVFAGAAFAQPAIEEDLGTLTAGASITRTTSSTGPQIRWYRFTLPAPVQMSDLSFLNIDTTGSAITDTEIGLYDAAGNFVATDDDDADGNRSALSFGSGNNTFPGPIAGTPAISNGRDKNLPAGTYFVAVGSFNMTFGTTNWNVTTAATSTVAANLVLNLGYGTATAAPLPAGTIDLGTVASGGSVSNSTGSLSTGQRIQWYRVTVPQALASAGTFVDMDTEGTLLTPGNTTRMVIYNATGALQSNTEFGTLADLTDGSNSLSQLTFGATTPARPAVGNGLAYNGRDGSLQAGTYLIAVAGTGTAPSLTATTGQSFGMTSTSTNFGSVSVRVAAGAPSISPSITGQSTSALQNAAAVIRATVTPGANPVSAISSVVADTTTIGGSTGVALNDSGLNGDAVAGDNIWSTTVTGTAAPATYTIPVVVTDALARTGSGNISFVIVPPIPACPPADATQTFSGLISTAAQGNAANSVVTASFGPGVGDKLRLTGRLTSVVGTSWRSEARIRVTGPSGTVYNLQPFTTTGVFTFADLTTPLEISIAGEDTAGTWTIETFESFDDTGTDASWDVCFGVTKLQSPSGSCSTTPNTAVEGTTANLSVTVAPVPGVSVASVIMDASSINPAETAVALTDPDGDNVFTGSVTATVLGSTTARALPFVVTGSTGIANSGSCSITITNSVSGACCLPSGCTINRSYECTLAGGANFVAGATDCGGLQSYIDGPGTGTFTSILATGTPVFAAGSRDDESVAVALPFTFNFFGTAQTSINVVSNGFANFGASSTTFTNTAIPSTGVPNNAIYPLWDDMLFTQGATAGVFTQTDGVAPNRTFTISWENVGEFSTTAPVGSNNFQIILTEGSDDIQFAYGAVSAITTPAVAGDTVTIGVENAAGTVARSVAPASVGTGGTSINFVSSISPNPCTPVCDSIDYNNDGVFPSDQDVVDFFDVLAGGTPATCDPILGCNDIDFNNDGVFPSDQDVIDFFNVLAGGECP